MKAVLNATKNYKKINKIQATHLQQVKRDSANDFKSKTTKSKNTEKKQSTLNMKFCCKLLL